MEFSPFFRLVSGNKLMKNVVRLIFLLETTLRGYTEGKWTEKLSVKRLIYFGWLMLLITSAKAVSIEQQCPHEMLQTSRIIPYLQTAQKCKKKRSGSYVETYRPTNTVNFWLRCSRKKNVWVGPYLIRLKIKATTHFFSNFKNGISYSNVCHF